mgnify:CR=1 FL=1
MIETRKLGGLTVSDICLGTMTFGKDTPPAEALALIDLAGPILPRLRGLERMGERRWDVVLDRGQRIMLPTDRPLPALQAAMAMDREDGLLVVEENCRAKTQQRFSLTPEQFRRPDVAVEVEGLTGALRGLLGAGG